HRLAACHRNSLLFVFPDLKNQKGPGFQFFGMFLNDSFQGLDQLLAPVRFWIFAREITVIGIDPEHFSWTGIGLELMSTLDKAARALAVIYISHRHPPISHGTVRIEKCNLSERSFRFEIPKSLKLSYALIEECLCLGMVGTDLQFYFACARE